MEWADAGGVWRGRRCSSERTIGGCLTESDFLAEEVVLEDGRLHRSGRAAHRDSWLSGEYTHLSEGLLSLQTDFDPLFRAAQELVQRCWVLSQFGAGLL